ncbi:hypothetical protein [Aestuariivita sp.]|jgi:hypothetical protein|uniref:DUF6950 family protein n=1 Tax=Aestuariivita sp. TaxID=1872407 RepID=UPI002172E696|nr:hypothetical protein [Aestuariivita sp.]MCE8007128.1 hypothetical protein [Aestuariivita sp.]
MKRRKDWMSRLTGYVGRTARLSIDPGTHDCALFLAGAVLAMTDVDFAAPYRGRYTTLRGGLRILRKDGFEDHIALARYHLETRPTAFLQVGDGAVVDTPLGPALGVVQGPSIYLVGYERQEVMPLTSAAYGFTV